MNKLAINWQNFAQVGVQLILEYARRIAHSIKYTHFRIKTYNITIAMSLNCMHSSNWYTRPWLVISKSWEKLRGWGKNGLDTMFPMSFARFLNLLSITDEVGIELKSLELESRNSASDVTIRLPNEELTNRIWRKNKLKQVLSTLKYWSFYSA